MTDASPAARKLGRSFRNVLRHFIILGAGLLIVCVSSAAIAQEAEDDDPFDRPGFYVGLTGVYAHNVFEDKIEDSIDDELVAGVSNFSLDIKDSGGLNALVGYRVASFFSTELQYEWIDEYDIKASASFGPLSASGTVYSIEGHTLTLNTKWIIPFWRIQPYILIGGGLAVYKVDRGSAASPLEFATGGDLDIDGGTHSALAGRFSTGIDWYVTQHIVINTQANVVLSTRNFKTPSAENADDLNYMAFGAGLQYRF
jgi:opacity protein-like surface antigen